MKYLGLMLMLVSHLSFSQESYLIEDVKLFDGYKVYQKVDIAIEDGRIHQIAKRIRPESKMEVVDGTNKTIIPGLINAHVHAWIPYHLKNALEAGVFAILDMHGPGAETKLLRDFKLEDGYAQFYSTGYAATVEGGHGTQYGFDVPTIGENFGVKDYISQALDIESDYIKIIYEPSKNTLSLNQVAELVEESHKNNLLAVSHISRYNEAKSIVDTNMDGLVHLWRDEMASPIFLEELARNNTFIIPTLSVLEGVLKYYNENGKKIDMLPLADLLSQVKELHSKGIKLLAGTDPPNVGLDYGWSLHNELELFVKAGMSPLEALKTATSNTAEAFSIEGIGTIKEGDIANFNLIDGDPLTDILQSRKIIAQWANGKKLNN